MKNIAIITARGGSKRIPRKNIKPFLGKPIIAYSIEVALACNLFDEVMVSTDDKEIAEISLKYGAKVPFMRSAKNADDYSTTVDVIIEVLNQYAEREVFFDYGCCLYPTAPFITKNILDKAFEVMIENRFNSVFPLVKYGTPIQRALSIDNDAKVSMINPEFKSTRSQDLKPAFHDAGQFYWFEVAQLLESQQLWSTNTGAIEIEENLTHDIDNPLDWKLAELKYKLSLEEKI